MIKQCLQSKILDQDLVPFESNDPSHVISEVALCYSELFYHRYY